MILKNFLRFLLNHSFYLLYVYISFIFHYLHSRILFKYTSIKLTILLQTTMEEVARGDPKSSLLQKLLSE
jgi:hypothetical protein